MTSGLRLLVVAVWLATGPAQGTNLATISGRVTGGAQPAASALVKLVPWMAGGPGETTTITGPDGAFEIRVPPGTYKLAASKLGYLSSDFTIAGLGAIATVASDASYRVPDLVLTRGAIIRGRVITAAARPAGQADVRLLRREVDGFSIADRATIDATGEYAFVGLPPGDYVVGVSATAAASIRSEGRYLVPAPAFFPNWPAEARDTFTVEAGQEFVAPDLLRPVTEAGSISGVVKRPDGTPAAGLDVRLVDEAEARGLLRFAGGQGRASTSSDGTFRFEGVAPGEYHLRARDTTSRPPRWLDAPIAIASGRTADIALTLQAGRTLAGKVEGRIEVLRFTAGSDVTTALIDATTRRFRMTGLGPGPLQVAGEANGRPVATILMNDLDLIDTGLSMALSDDDLELDLTVHDKMGQLAGRIDSEGREMKWLSAMIVSTDQRYWTRQSRRVKYVPIGEDGRLPAVDLPPGQYAVAVFQGLTSDHARDQQWLALALQTGVRATVVGGETTQLTLRPR